MTTIYAVTDVLSINNRIFSEYLDTIYPSELYMKDINDFLYFVNFLDLFLRLKKIKNNNLFHKCDDFNFNIVDFPFLVAIYQVHHP